MRSMCTVVLFAAVLCRLSPAEAATADGVLIAELRAELKAMAQDYDARLTALQTQMDAMKVNTPGAASTARAVSIPTESLGTVDAADDLTGAANTRAATVATASPGTSAGNAFNPNIGLNLQGRYGAFRRTPNVRTIAGFQLGRETGPGDRGLSLNESELSLSANVDDRFFGFANLAFVENNGESAVSVEEVYFQTTALPYGFTVRAGQFFSAIGYQNARHSHAWDFVDQPLAYEALLNGQYLDPGLRVSWLAPTDLFAEFGVEAFRGDRFPGGGAARDGVGTTNLYGTFGGDLSVSSAWQAGVSWLAAHPRQRHYEAATGQITEFTGVSDLLTADLIWKWSPQGNFHDRNLSVQAEWLHRHERGALNLLTGEAPAVGRYHGKQDGWYAQAVYQFTPRWRVGLRYDELASANQVNGLPELTILDGDSAAPRRYSAMLDFSNSEFSRFRLQYNRDESDLRNADQIFLQYIMSLGAHGAHAF